MPAVFSIAVDIKGRRKKTKNHFSFSISVDNISVDKDATRARAHDRITASKSNCKLPILSTAMK